MSKFLTHLDVIDTDNEGIWVLGNALVYYSDLLNDIVHVPKGFYTDLASVPRIPIIYSMWGDRSHHEAVIHDYLYRVNSVPFVAFETANKVFLEAMTVRNKPWHIKKFMYLGVCIGGKPSYHKHFVGDKL